MKVKTMRPVAEVIEALMATLRGRRLYELAT